MASCDTENWTTTRRSRLQLFRGIGWQARQQRRLGRGWRSTGRSGVNFNEAAAERVVEYLG
jgi:hypothetical protein